MTIGLRLTQAFAMVSLIIGVGAVVAVWQFDTVVQQTRNIIAIDDRLRAAGRLERDITTLERELSDAAVGQDKQHLLHAITVTRASVSEHLRQAETAFHESGAVAPATLRASMASTQDETEALERLAEREDWTAIHLRVRIQLAQVLGEVAAVVDEISAGVATAREQALREIETRRSGARNMLAATALSSLMASFLLGFHVTRSITRPLRDLKRAAHQLAFSDFHLRLETHSKDELADVGRDLMAAARQLEASYNALKRSNQDLERFAAAVSHDLREPLRTVTMFTQLLKADHESAFQGEASEYLKLISDAAFQMNRLIDGILQYSLVTSTQGHDLEDLPLYEVVRTAISNLRVAIDETGTTVHCGFLPVIRANRVQMEQIFQNLIGNAIKYRREGIPPHIEIEAREKGQDWIISVADNGTGIDPRYHERIFGIFRQLDRHSEGIGLGLAVAKRIIEQLGGSIWVESDGQNGSRFFLAIPRISSFNTRTADTEPEASMT